jgi:hypothetical protein
MKTKTNLINELSLRVYQKIGEEQLKSLLMDGKPLMTHDELTKHISVNLNDFLNTEEQKQLIIDNIYNVDDEKIKSLMIKLAIEMAAGYVQSAIEKALTSEDFVGDNPYSALTVPRMFMMYKYYNEKSEVNLNTKSLDDPLEC